MADETCCGFDWVYARPGDYGSIIDVVDPVTNRSRVYSEDLDQIRQRYPDAVIMVWADWQAGKAALQQTEVVWSRVTERKYHEMLEVLPPVAWTADGFMVGEPEDHCIMTGAPRFRAYLHRGGVYLVASRPMTVREFKAVR